jgi:hypothetical protein
VTRTARGCALRIEVVANRARACGACGLCGEGEFRRAVAAWLLECGRIFWRVEAVRDGSRRTGRADSGGRGSRQRRLGFAAAAGVSGTRAGWRESRRLRLAAESRAGVRDGGRGFRRAKMDWRGQSRVQA